MSSDLTRASVPPCEPLPRQLCNLDRLLHAMEKRGLDAIVATSANNVFYLSGFNGIAHKSDEPRPYAFVLSRHAPRSPVLVVADYYLGTALSMSTWVETIRSFRAVMLPLDLPAGDLDMDRFLPDALADDPRVVEIRARYADGLGTACRAVLDELKLSGARIGFDDPRFGAQLGLASSNMADAYDALMFARAVKTPAELRLLRRATTLNETAILRSIHSWSPGMTWREFNHAYNCAVAELGGFVRDPGGMVWGHPRGADPAITLYARGDDFELTPGMHVMFDCHGTVDMYCWDGGKTWVIDDEPRGVAWTNARACAEAAAETMARMRPGVRISELQGAARQVFRRCGVADADRAIVFFHGLGLSHMDIEQTTAAGRPNVDWQLEAGMVVPLHILYPGGERERVWVEEVVEVAADGGKPFFSWGFDTINGRG
ncbi:MAG: M24 family metallopeptidase [Gammaproteobacteria bacterium]|nr:M24 family metallopeptidase [Gammaproteobacteria bacterium]